MAALAGAELVAALVCGGDLPEYAAVLDLTSNEDPTYTALLRNWDLAAGQL